MTRFNMIHHPIETCFKYIAQANSIPATIVPQSINTHSARLSRSCVFIGTSLRTNAVTILTMASPSLGSAQADFPFWSARVKVS